MLYESDTLIHYIDVIMTTMASQITSLTVVYSTVYSGTDQRKHQSPASLDRWIPRTKRQLRGKCFHLMTSSCHMWFPATVYVNRIDEILWKFSYVICDVATLIVLWYNAMTLWYHGTSVLIVMSHNGSNVLWIFIRKSWSPRRDSKERATAAPPSTPPQDHWHYNDVIMSAMGFQIAGVSIVYWTVYSGDRWIPHTKGQWRGKCFHSMTSPC